MKLDELESVFKSAAKSRFRAQPVTTEKILLVTDLAGEELRQYQESVTEFLDPLSGKFDLNVFSTESEDHLGELLNMVTTNPPDMICTYRNLNSRAWQFGYSLGEHLDLMTQSTDVPVLVLPNPKSEEHWKKIIRRPRSVMVVTDHLTGDDRLVSYGLAFTPDEGNLFLSHVEDEVWYQRFLDYIAKIPDIDTDVAKQKISHQLIKEPTEYAASVSDNLKENGSNRKIEIMVTVGQELEVYRQWLKEHLIDLVVLNTKDDHQMAMSGFAHAFAVEFRDVPTLML